MRLGIISDTHDQVARTAQALRILVAEGADAVVHCGDLTRPEVVRQFTVLPSYFVFGNNDYDHDSLLRAVAAIGGTCLGRGGVLELEGKKIAVVHGDSGREVRRLAALEPDYLLYGHSHVAADERRGPTRWINPGALYRAPVWTAVVLDLATDELRSFVIQEAG